jgi:two-component system chemotaxis sensor kinase CheA
MAARPHELQARLLGMFRLEAEEHLSAVATALLALDGGLPPEQTRDAVETVFRAMHTLKGAARSVALRDIEARCQDLESVLSKVKRGQTPLSHDVVAGLQQGAGDVNRLVAGLQPAAPAPEPAAVAPVPQAVRVNADLLDAVHARTEDLLGAKLAAHERVVAARALADDLARDGGRPGLDRGLVQRARALLGALLHDQRVLASAVDALQDGTRHLRMLPAASALEAFPGMVADLARAQQKEVDWQVSGAEMEVDRKVLETIREPLLHLVRNAIDHGIEPPAERAASGKARRGKVKVAFAPLEGRRVEVRVEDDGAGIDLAGVRAAAVRARVAGVEEAERLPEGAVLDLVFASGVSTSPVVTDLSGHGLGMAIVRDRVERLGGRLALDTRPGNGTAVRMEVPATVATFRGLLVRAGSQPVLLPLGSVERVIRVAARDVEAAAGGSAIRYLRKALPVAALARVLGWPGEEPLNGTPRPCVVVDGGGPRAGFFVEEVLGEREVLVKELAPPLRRVRYVAAGAVLGHGGLALILRPQDLVRGAGERPAAVAPPDQPRGPAAVLVVDDSITTRTMERNLLEAAGYQVEVAADGLEAWTALRTRRFDLVLSDVDMPRLNGFDLTARIRADPRLAELPVVLVTALESREERERGMEVGANAYVIKSGFDHQALLEMIQRLV